MAKLFAQPFLRNSRPPRDFNETYMFTHLKLNPVLIARLYLA